MTRDECYRILEVSLDATDDEIRRSYLRLSKQYHPDINPNGKNKFQQITQAYEHITNKTFTDIGYNQYTNKSSYNNTNRTNYNQNNQWNNTRKPFTVDFKQLWKTFEKLRKSGGASFVASFIIKLLGSLGIIFIFLRPLIEELMLVLRFVSTNIFYILKHIAIILAWIVTLILINIANSIVTVLNFLYTLTINPMITIIKVPTKLIGPFISDLKPLILIAIALSIFIKIRDTDDKNKANIFITSTIILMIVICCDIFN